jgi:hypothetical protein
MAASSLARRQKDASFYMEGERTLRLCNSFCVYVCIYYVRSARDMCVQSVRRQRGHVMCTGGGERTCAYAVHTFCTL